MDGFVDRRKLGIGYCNPEVFENKSYADGWNAVIKILEEAPAAKVREDITAEWVDNGIPGSMLSGCSMCGYTCGAYSMNFCPNCGARMTSQRDAEKTKSAT